MLKVLQPPRIRTPTERKRLLLVVCFAVFVAYVVLVAAGIDQQHPPDFAAFYTVARALRLGGLGAAHRMYSLSFQIAAGRILRGGRQGEFLDPFVNPPTAAWVVIPFTTLPLHQAFLTWDSLCLVLLVAGTFWLARLELPGRDATLIAVAALACYPSYLALGKGQYDLLWPICLALFTSALRIPSVRRWLPRCAAAVFIFTFKPDLLIALIVPAVRRWRDPVIRAAFACLAAISVIAFTTIGFSGLMSAFHLERYTLLKRFPPIRDTTILGFLWRVIGPGHLSEELATAAIVVAVAALGWAWWRNPPTSPGAWRFAMTSAVCLSLLIAPHALSHSMVLLVGPVIWVARGLRERHRSLWILAGWIVLFNAVFILSTTPKLTLPFPPTAVLLLVASVCAWRARGHAQVTPTTLPAIA